MEEICKLHAEDWHALKDNYSCALKAKSERLNDKKKKELIALYHKKL
jgi:cyclopropane fatty-acyl-phospholipid synthase-like methyltransferase